MEIQLSLFRSIVWYSVKRVNLMISRRNVSFDIMVDTNNYNENVEIVPIYLEIKQYPLCISDLFFTVTITVFANKEILSEIISIISIIIILNIHCLNNLINNQIVETSILRVHLTFKGLRNVFFPSRPRFVSTWNKYLINIFFLYMKMSNFSSNLINIFCWKLQGQIMHVLYLSSQDNISIKFVDRNTINNIAPTPILHTHNMYVKWSCPDLILYIWKIIIIHFDYQTLLNLKRMFWFTYLLETPHI